MIFSVVLARRDQQWLPTSRNRQARRPRQQTSPGVAGPCDVAGSIEVASYGALGHVFTSIHPTTNFSAHSAAAQSLKQLTLSGSILLVVLKRGKSATRGVLSRLKSTKIVISFFGGPRWGSLRYCLVDWEENSPSPFFASSTPSAPRFVLPLAPSPVDAIGKDKRLSSTVTIRRAMLSLATRGRAALTGRPDLIC